MKGKVVRAECWSSGKGEMDSFPKTDFSKDLGWQRWAREIFFKVIERLDQYFCFFQLNFLPVWNFSQCKSELRLDHTEFLVFKGYTRFRWLTAVKCLLGSRHIHTVNWLHWLHLVHSVNSLPASTFFLLPIYISSACPPVITGMA
jgi:hypothetical protein